MGGFMAAAAHAVRANNQARARRQKEADQSAADRGQLTAHEREVLSQINRDNDAALEPSRVAAEAALGRVETREEIITRECDVLGYSPTSMKRSW